MGLIVGRLNLDGLHSGRRRSQQEEGLYSYSLNKNYFSNYFLMGGERFEVNDPNYLFGDNCDLNFLSCTKPYSLPYKKSQQNLLRNLNAKPKAINKVSSRVNKLSSTFDIITGRHRQLSLIRKQDAQTQTLNSTKSLSNGPEPSQPLVITINIRKETLRLVKSNNMQLLNNHPSSSNNTFSISNDSGKSSEERSTLRQAHKQSSFKEQNNHSSQVNRHSIVSRATTTTIRSTDSDNIDLGQTAYYSKNYHDSDSSSIASNTPSITHSITTSTNTSKSGYTSVKDAPISECASDEYFEDALIDPTNLSLKEDQHGQIKCNPKQQESLTHETKSTRDNRDITQKIESSVRVNSKTDIDLEHENGQNNINATSIKYSSNEKRPISTQSKSNNQQDVIDNSISARNEHLSNHAYNIEFYFDAEVDCSIRIFYFCTREISTQNMSYKPQHAPYKSKTYIYKRGLNQKFEQSDHIFEPHLFDEDLLTYKPLDENGNYNSSAKFPIVIHCVALDGSNSRQSQLLVATVEKSQLDDSYSIKPLKQMIFADGVRYILQDIYGIENRALLENRHSSLSRISKMNRNLRSSCGSLYSTSNFGSNLNLSETASLASVVDTSVTGPHNGESLVSNQYKSFGSENTFECVICMSEERDTMLLPCRHLCLCGSCAQSLRYQASSCPICRCPFKAALNLRVIHRKHRSHEERSWTSITNNEGNNNSKNTPTSKGNRGKSRKQHQSDKRRDSITNPSTPLLATSKKDAINLASARIESSARVQDVVDAVRFNAPESLSSPLAGRSDSERDLHDMSKESASLEMRSQCNGAQAKD